MTPRDGSGIYHRPPGTDAITQTTIASTPYNADVADVEQDLNLPRPIVAGGTAATSPDTALKNLSAEKASQVVTDFSTATWMAGSFYAATTAANSPVAGHAFAGICYYSDATNLVIEARDLTDPANPVYIRVMTAGVWGPFTTEAMTGAVRYDIAQTLTLNQQAQARANIAVQKKNYIINGAMMLSQENSTAAGTTANYSAADGFYTSYSVGGGVLSSAQVSSLTPGGSPNRMRMTVTTAQATMAAGNYCFFYQKLEGLRVSDLKFGTTGARTFTLQFGVKAPTGTYCITLQNAAGNRCYIAEYIITAGQANTDTVISITFPGDVAGTWPTDNTVGIMVGWALAVGSTYQTSSVNTWLAAGLLGTANQFNLFGSGGNTFEVFDIGLYEGTVAPPFMVPDYISEFALCQRYLQAPWGGGYGYAGWLPTTTIARIGYSFRTLMRAVPTLLVKNPAININHPGGNSTGTSITITAGSAGIGGAPLDVTCSGTPFTVGAPCSAALQAGTILFDARL